MTVARFELDHRRLTPAQVDEESPLVREWALWAVRNLCEGDEGAREAITALSVTDVVQDAALQRAGLAMQLDAATGRPRAVRQ